VDGVKCRPGYYSAGAVLTPSRRRERGLKGLTYIKAPHSAREQPFCLASTKGPARKTRRPLMLSYDQAAAKKQWREAVRAVAEAIEDAGGVVNNVNEARLDAVEAWIGESRQWLLAGLRQGRIDVAKANRAMWAADELLYRIERVRERIRNT